MIQFDLLAYFTPALHPRSCIQDKSFIYMKNSEYSCFDFAYSLLSFMEQKACIIPNAHKMSFYLVFLFLCRLFFLYVLFFSSNL